MSVILLISFYALCTYAAVRIGLRALRFALRWKWFSWAMSWVVFFGVIAAVLTCIMAIGQGASAGAMMFLISGIVVCYNNALKEASRSAAVIPESIHIPEQEILPPQMVLTISKP